MDIAMSAVAKRPYAGKEANGNIDPIEVNPERIQYLRNLAGLLTEEDLQLILGVSDWTLQQWRMDGKGPRFAKLGKGVFYRLEDIMVWIAANVRQITGEERAA